MSNPWISGQFAKLVTNKKRPRWFWNVFFSVLIIFILILECVLIFQVVADYVKHTEEHVFVEYKNQMLITYTSSFEVAEYNKQKVEIQGLIEKVDVGETITIAVSDISGELLEVKFFDEVVYKKEYTPITPLIVLSCVFVIPLIVFCVFMLIVTNIKNPCEKIDKIQSKFLLRIYK